MEGGSKEKKAENGNGTFANGKRNTMVNKEEGEDIKGMKKNYKVLCASVNSSMVTVIFINGEQTLMKICDLLDKKLPYTCIIHPPKIHRLTHTPTQPYMS